MANICLKNYVIAELGICVNVPWGEKISDCFEPFLGGDTEDSYQVFFEEKEHLPENLGKKVFENQGFAVFMDEQGRCVRRFHDSQKAYTAYAVMRMENENRKIFITYLQGAEYYFGNSRKDFFHIGWEKVLIHEKRMILHSACVETAFGGILFSGPSGIGKSTQAGLWCEHRNARLINGDKPILRKVDKEWRAYGSPYAGSSKCHVNESCSVRAIVMLKKAGECSLRKMNPLEAFRQIYEQMIINSWDKDYVAIVCDLTLELVNEVSIYELACTPNQEAVKILEEELGRKRDLWI